MKLYAFADEASGALEGQIAALKRNGLDGMEIRGTDWGNVSSISLDQAREIRKRLQEQGLRVWSVGSPIGKIDIEKDDFEQHMEVFRHTLEIAKVLECGNLRMFSFYLPAGKDPADYTEEVVARLTRMVAEAKEAGIRLCHENEKGIYGDNAPRCALLLDRVPGLGCVFDPANFIQCGQEIPAAWNLLKDRVDYMHIKDALADGTVVPAGQGLGCLKEILADYAARGGEALTLEPHLRIFDGLAALEKDQKTEIPAYAYQTSDEAFDAAAGALKSILPEQ